MLTNNGLYIKAFCQGAAGIMITHEQYDMTELTEDYTISVTMLSKHTNLSGTNESATQTNKPNRKNRTYLIFGAGSDISSNVDAAGEWGFLSDMQDDTKNALKVCGNQEGTETYWARGDALLTGTTSVIAKNVIYGEIAIIYDFLVDVDTKQISTVKMTLASDTSKVWTHTLGTPISLGNDGNFCLGFRELYDDTAWTYMEGWISDISIKTSSETKYSVDFAERYADIQNCRATVKGGQLSSDNTTLRVVSELNMTEAELANYASHGFEISLKDSTKGAKILSSTTVYTSIKAAGETVTATDGYLGVMTVTGLSAGKSYTFVVRAYVTDAAGNKYVSAAKEISVTVA
ncbi:MAG: hypothetical protein IJY08_03400 [Clostridia bacterium]|nr:hypothetical protein [Clostridia bacterium]